jgi:hypothetical protein
LGSLDPLNQNTFLKVFSHVKVFSDNADPAGGSASASAWLSPALVSAPEPPSAVLLAVGGVVLLLGGAAARRGQQPGG